MGIRVGRDTEPDIVDPACVPDTFVEGIGLIEILPGYNMRITWYQTRDLGDGIKERQVAVRLVGSILLVPNSVRQIIGAVAGLPFMSDSVAAPDIVPN